MPTPSRATVGRIAIVQRVAVDDPPLRQAEGARRADVVLAHHLEHRGAHQARDVADPAEPDGERRQHQMAQLVAEIARLAGADRRQPAQPTAKTSRE